MSDEQRRQQAQQNRERLPRFTVWLDAMRAAFGPGVRVVWAQEGDVLVGKIPAASE